MTELPDRTATELAALIRERRASSLEVVDACLARIAERNPALNAVVTVDADGAREQAVRADAALGRGELWGALHGVPLTVKDAFNTGGMRTTCGYPPLAGNVPATDAGAIAKLRGAGAIVLGKTNVPPLLDGSQTDNPLFGRTNNPWDLERTPGGSSGGSAAAVAAGLVPADLGSDYGGSIRIPAHWCGVYGLRPTEQRASMAGHLPPLDGQPRGVRHVTTPGPLARSVADLDLLLRVIAGPDGREWEVPPVPLEPLPPLTFAEARIAWSPGFGDAPVSAETRGVLETLAGNLSVAGCHVEERDLTRYGFDLDAARETLATITHAEWSASGWDDLDPDPNGAPPPTMREYTLALTRRDGLIAALQRLFVEFDAFICPVSATPAIRHCPPGTPIEVDGRTVPYRRAISALTGPLSLPGCPIVAVPAGRSGEGLPIGAQIVGPRWGEARLLAVAGLVERVTGGFGGYGSIGQ